MVRELKESVYFVISETIKIEYDSLKMNNKHIGCLRNKGPLADVYLFLTAIALVITNNFSFNQLFQTIMKRFNILDCY